MNSRAEEWAAKCDELLAENERLRELMGYVKPAIEHTLEHHGPDLHTVGEPGMNVTVAWRTSYDTCENFLAALASGKKGEGGG